MREWRESTNQLIFPPHPPFFFADASETPPSTGLLNLGVHPKHLDGRHGIKWHHVGTAGVVTCAWHYMILVICIMYLTYNCMSITYICINHATETFYFCVTLALGSCIKTLILCSPRHLHHFLTFLLIWQEWEMKPLEREYISKVLLSIELLSLFRDNRSLPICAESGPTIAHLILSDNLYKH